MPRSTDPEIAHSKLGPPRATDPVGASARCPPAQPGRAGVRAIYEAVQERRLEPALKLREVELTTLFKMSRTSVRTALLRLSHKSILDISANRGATVAKPRSRLIPRRRADRHASADGG